MNARVVTAVGLAVVLVAAAVLSFDALRGLALAVAIPRHLAWLLPVGIDAGAAVSCAVWLSRGTPTEAARFARAITWALLAVTIGGNAGQSAMHAHSIAPPWWVAVLVGSIAPAVAGATVHLLVLLVRRDELATDAVTDPAAVPTPEHPVEHPVAGLRIGDEVPAVDDPAAPDVVDEPVTEPIVAPDRTAELIAAGAGRRRLARELGIPEHRARVLLAAHRNGAAA